MPYIRVAANVKDAYTRVSSVYAAAFKTSNPNIGPFHNPDGTTVNESELISFMENKINTDGVPTTPSIKRMFDPRDSTYPIHVSVGENVNMIAFMDTTFTDVYSSGESSIVQSTSDLINYYVYIYAKNDTGYTLIQPSSVEMVV
jgi:hypothetical protein